ncbi:histidinol-phosphate transaminase [Acinetobacter oleivorans]|uniref:histidinol-phosphate transaminase n=1 Tax=Acinetobacter TaxID=469 RepID=UPI000DCFCBCD|nr:histidinol-phosphate transaminase [Acinetobacter oleivorans]MDV7644922.1 histidinol-phosphate transaminase [Acinetobacter baumannii]
MENIFNQPNLDPLRFWSPEIRNLQPYQPGEQPKEKKFIKLNTNENPYPPSPQVSLAIKQNLGITAEILRLYPDPDAGALREIIAEQNKLKSDQVFIGNGSDEVLSFIFKAFFLHPNKPILYPDISYSFYPVYCQFYGIKPIAIPVNKNFEICITDYSQDNCGIIIANPNAPTGIALSLSEIELLLCSHKDSVVVVDEAYVDFGAESATQLIPRYDNLIVCQTTSKSRSLAGLRVGFAMAQPHLIAALDRVKNSFNSFPIDSLAIAAAYAAFQDQSYFEKICQRIINEREILCNKMEQMGFSILPSKANFIFASHDKYDGSELASKLKQNGILVRHFNKPRINSFLRITIGSKEENLALIKVLKELV